MRNWMNTSMMVWSGQPMNGILLLAVKGQNQRWMNQKLDSPIESPNRILVNRHEEEDKVCDMVRNENYAMLDWIGWAMMMMMVIDDHQYGK